MRRIHVLLLVLPLLVSFPSAAFAQALQSNFGVTGNVSGFFFVAGNFADVGTVNDPTTEIATGSGSVIVQGPVGASATLSFDTGLNPDGSTRQMACGVGFWPYGASVGGVPVGDDGITSPDPSLNIMTNGSTQNINVDVETELVALQLTGFCGDTIGVTFTPS